MYFAYPPIPAPDTQSIKPYDEEVVKPPSPCSQPYNVLVIMVIRHELKNYQTTYISLQYRKMGTGKSTFYT